MIIDTLDHADQYTAILPGLEAAFAFLRRTDLATLPDGRHELDGKRLYVLLQSYQTKPRLGGRPEAHRRYVDVQCLLAGREVCGYAPLTDALAVATPYDPERDFMLFNETACDFITLIPGMFAVFGPQDLHLPGCQPANVPESVRKAVVKILLPQSAT